MCRESCAGQVKQDVLKKPRTPGEDERTVDRMRRAMDLCYAIRSYFDFDSDFSSR